VGESDAAARVCLPSAAQSSTAATEGRRRATVKKSPHQSAVTYRADVHLQAAASTHDQLTGVIVGAGLTLVAALLVQTIVIPLVQRATRRRAQWETDILTLQSLLDEHLPRAIARYRAAADTERIWLQVKDDPNYDQDKIKQRFEEAGIVRDESEDLAAQRVVQVRSLVARACQLHKTSPRWRPVRLHEQQMRMHLQLMPDRYGEHVDDDKWDAQWQKVNRARQALTDQIAPLALTMKPPDRQVIRRYARKASKVTKTAAQLARDRIAAIRTVVERLRSRGA
jgi:hypothetical protein